MEELKENFRIYGVLFIIPIVLIIAVISARNYFSANDEKNQLQTEVDDLNSTINTYKTNQSLIQGNIDDYNHLLLSIIPDKEDYFSIIIALEKLSQDTGFAITKYGINLADSTGEKISLSVEGEGDPNSFLKFLQNYQYDGGRLITNEKMVYTTLDANKTVVSLNFYHKTLPALAQKIEPISQKDINLTKEIEQKVTISLKDDTTTEALYDVKANPF